MVVVLPATSDICIIRNPITLNANAKFNTAEIRYIVSKVQKEIGRQGEKEMVTVPKARKVVARVPGVPGISPSLKNAMKCGSNDKVTRLVSRNV